MHSTVAFFTVLLFSASINADHHHRTVETILPEGHVETAKVVDNNENVDVVAAEIVANDEVASPINVVVPSVVVDKPEKRHHPMTLQVQPVTPYAMLYRQSHGHDDVLRQQVHAQQQVQQPQYELVEDMTAASMPLMIMPQPYMPQVRFIPASGGFSGNLGPLGASAGLALHPDAQRIFAAGFQAGLGHQFSTFGSYPHYQTFYTNSATASNAAAARTADAGFSGYNSFNGNYYHGYSPYYRRFNYPYYNQQYYRY